MKKQTPLPSWLSLALRLIPAVLLLQSLIFKFSGAEVSKLLFTTIGMEPWGRIGIGTAELIVGLLLLYRPTVFWGVLGSLGLIAGAIFFHLFTSLGIEIALPEGGTDGGQLFAMAVVIFLLSLLNVYFHRSSFRTLFQK
jgi:hypothetical protein